MKIGFIGAGNVGYTLGKYLNEKYHNVIGYYSKNVLDSKDAALFVKCEYYEKINELILNCDTLFLTVNDNSLENIRNILLNLKIKNKIIIHTSGCHSSLILGDLVNNNYCYSLHPIYAFNNKYDDYKSINNIYFTLEGNPLYLDIIKKLFENKVNIIDTFNKPLYHAYCVFISNLINGVVNIAYEGFNKLGIDFNSIIPLFKNNIDNIIKKGPKESLTGPILRNDFNTISSHLKVLNNDEKEIYIDLSKELIKIAKTRNNNDYSKLDNILKEYSDNEKDN